jgi:hypothetical protein
MNEFTLRMVLEILLKPEFCASLTTWLLRLCIGACRHGAAAPAAFRACCRRRTRRRRRPRLFPEDARTVPVAAAPTGATPGTGAAFEPVRRHPVSGLVRFRD